MGFHRFVLPHGFSSLLFSTFRFLPFGSCSPLVSTCRYSAEKSQQTTSRDILILETASYCICICKQKTKKTSNVRMKKKTSFTKSRSFKKLHLQVAPAFRPPRYGRSSPLTFTCYTEAARGSVEPRWPKKSCMDTAYVWEIPSPYNKVQEVPSILGIWNSWWCKGPMNIFGWAVDYFLHFRPSFSFLLLTSLVFP